MTDDNVAHLPTRAMPRQPHVLGEGIKIAATESDTGFEHLEKTCKNCGTVRVTVLGAQYSRRAWRLFEGGPLIDHAEELLCPQTARAP